MSKKFSLAHLTVLQCAAPELVYTAALAGYDYFSPRLVNLGVVGERNNDLAAQPEILAATKRAMAETGLRAHDIEIMAIRDNTNVRAFESAIEVGAELGAKQILSSIWTDNKPVYLEKFAELCDLAAQYEMDVQLEFVTWASVYNLEMAMDVLNTIQRPNVGIMVDTLHAHRSRVSPAEIAAVDQGLYHFCHICDGPASIPDADSKEELIVIGRDARRYLGDGKIDIAGYMHALPKDIVCSIELPNLAAVKEFGPAEHARRCLQSSKDLFAREGVL